MSLSQNIDQLLPLRYTVAHGRRARGYELDAMSWSLRAVQDLQVVVGAFDYATPAEFRDILERFIDRVPEPRGPADESALEGLLRTFSLKFDARTQRPRDVPPFLFLFELETEGPRERFRRAIRRLTELDVIAHSERPGAELDSAECDEPDGEPILPSQPEPHWRIVRFHLFMERAYAIPSLKEQNAAADQEISVRHLSRLLAQTGHSFRWWRDTYRLRAARRLLRDTTLPDKCIADRAGFSNEDQLHEAFSQRYRMSTAAYRTRAFLYQWRRLRAWDKNPHSVA
jgi:AraC-like DNA-binding protein